MKKGTRLGQVREPGSGKDYDPNDPHFNPMHPPKGYPQDALEREWGDPNFTIVRDEDKENAGENKRQA